MKTILALGTALLVAAPAAAQQERVPRSMGGGDCAENVYNCADTPNPLPEATSVWIEELTWMDVRDALHAGKTTVIIPTGGMEPSGPWLATGKHNYVLRANCEAVARRLGNALCAPIVKYVPEGNIDPPSGHMASPGTISLRQESFDAMLTDIAHSLKVHGFRNIIFFGDSGGNQGGQRAVANRLNEMWDGTVVAHVQEYYDYAGVERYMAYRGFPESTEDGLQRRPDHHAEHVRHRPVLGPLRRACGGWQGDDQRRLHRGSRAVAGVGARDRSVPCPAHGSLHR